MEKGGGTLFKEPTIKEASKNEGTLSKGSTITAFNIMIQIVHANDCAYDL